MNHCQNCGQANNLGSNFCRFCGTRIVIPQNPRPMLQSPPQQSSGPFEYKAPRPYVWKTDEFQLPENSEKRSKQINQVQPISNLAPQQQQYPAPQRYAQPQHFYQQNQPLVNYGYRCPHCGTQNIPLYTRKISAAGWIVFAVLLVMFFPLFWIGFLIKEDVKICPVCSMRVG